MRNVLADLDAAEQADNLDETADFLQRGRVRAGRAEGGDGEEEDLV